MSSVAAPGPVKNAASREPWLRALVACSLLADAEAIRAALREHRLPTRSIPAGRSKGAWSALTDAGPIAIVVSGRGDAAAQEAAGFWMLRSRVVVVTGTAEATGLLPAGTVVAGAIPERDLALGSGDGAAVIGRIAGVRIAIRSEQARSSLAGIDIAGTDSGEADVWRRAAAAAGAVYQRYHGLVEATEFDERPLDLIPAGTAAIPAWRSILAAIARPAQRRAVESARAAARAPREQAAAAAVRAILHGIAR